jgi:L-rhamnose mutarotase
MYYFVLSDIEQDCFLPYNELMEHVYPDVQQLMKENNIRFTILTDGLFELVEGFNSPTQVEGLPRLMRQNK